MRKAINHLKKSDPIMRSIIEQVGPFRMEFNPPEFASLAESIVYQQLNGAAAASIFTRFVALAGDPLTPKGILKLTDEQMRAGGMSKQKTAYLRDLAAKTLSGAVDFKRLPDLTEQEVIEHLTQVKGIGVWTAHMFLMFTLKRPDILPTGDYGEQAALQETKIAQAAHYGKNCQTLGSLSQHCLVVSVAKPEHQDPLVAAYA